MSKVLIQLIPKILNDSIKSIYQKSNYGNKLIMVQGLSLSTSILYVLIKQLLTAPKNNIKPKICHWQSKILDKKLCLLLSISFRPHPGESCCCWESLRWPEPERLNWQGTLSTQGRTDTFRVLFCKQNLHLIYDEDILIWFFIPFYLLS